MKLATPFSPSSRKSALLIAAFAATVGAAPMAAQAAPHNNNCRECGTVVSTRTVERAPERASGLGAGAGAVVGGLLGNQIGSGNGRTLATVAGAVGGAYAGNNIERSRNTYTVTQVRVRMSDGSMRTFNERNQGFRDGQQVRVRNGSLVHR